MSKSDRHTIASVTSEIGISAEHWPLLDELQLEPKLVPRFADSSCDIWPVLHTPTDQRLFIKRVAKQESPSPFWQVMGHLFEQHLADAIVGSDELSQLLKEFTATSAIEVPHCHQTAENEAYAFALFAELGGQVAENKNVFMIEQLAELLALLHQNEFAQVGRLQQETAGSLALFSEQNWRMRLMKLFYVMDVESIDIDTQQALIEQLDSIAIERVVPLMMDLRWDQLAVDNGSLSGIYDLDAFVAAPVEFDFVILEYLLDKIELERFISVYSAKSDMAVPALKNVRQVYRTVLYLMNVLGEEDYQRWMQQPHFFD
ncbi:phosphotransferase [Thiomicrorhabdus sediminis]|uniref:Aminoglycoside phosphotransferase domain-containing protein n=1 Tax=Thiomicrorhabdus sediminis TaxID=2580412 RepID=A0A4P9K8F3_9GAMM|nr:phosphotransferase [Thiomicrorhabdus sediminis]QCU90567.1 hypothetical protein FE785_07935 [Thiomicrorhabdus sediminis]